MHCFTLPPNLRCRHHSNSSAASLSTEDSSEDEQSLQHQHDQPQPVLTSLRRGIKHFISKCRSKKNLHSGEYYDIKWVEIAGNPPTERGQSRTGAWGWRTLELWRHSVFVLCKRVVMAIRKMLLDSVERRVKIEDDVPLEDSERDFGEYIRYLQEKYALS